MPKPRSTTTTTRTLKTRAAPQRRLRWGRVGAVGFLLLCGWLGYEYGTLPDVEAYEQQNPETTALIEARVQQAREAGKDPKRRQRWVGLAQLPKYAVDAVLISEDARFYQHEGVDLKETTKALEEAWEKKAFGRGASTITQQLAKNLWLSGDRSLVRKVKELVLAKRLEEKLPKRRILTLYLNVAEWGEGVYGIEAAAQTHFGVPGSSLSVAQAAILAGMLPAPRTWSPAAKSPRLRTRALRVVERLERFGRISAEAAVAARGEIDALWGAPIDASG